MPADMRPFDPIRELGLTELIGINEKVDQNDYSASEDITIAPGPQPASGVIHQVVFYQTEDGSGSIHSPAGTLYILDADPAVASGATAITAAEWVTVIGKVDVAATDWKTDTAGGFAMPSHDPIYFHALSTLYVTFKLTSATGLNDAAGDDEQLEMNGWYQLYS